MLPLLSKNPEKMQIQQFSTTSPLLSAGSAFFYFNENSERGRGVLQ